MKNYLKSNRVILFCSALAILFSQQTISQAAHPPHPYPHCPPGKNCSVNSRLFGYHQTQWRRWPGSQVLPTDSKSNPDNLPEIPKSDTPVSDDSRFDKAPKLPLDNSLPNNIQLPNNQLPKPPNKLPPPTIKKPGVTNPNLPPPGVINPNDIKNPFGDEKPRKPGLKNKAGKLFRKKTNSVRTAAAWMIPKTVKAELSLSPPPAQAAVHQFPIKKKPATQSSNPLRRGGRSSSSNPLREKYTSGNGRIIRIDHVDGFDE